MPGIVISSESESESESQDESSSDEVELNPSILRKRRSSENSYQTQSSSWSSREQQLLIQLCKKGLNKPDVIDWKLTSKRLKRTIPDCQRKWHALRLKNSRKRKRKLPMPQKKNVKQVKRSPSNNITPNFNTFHEVQQTREGKWISYVRINERLHNCGEFNDQLTAARERDYMIFQNGWQAIVPLNFHYDVPPKIPNSNKSEKTPSIIKRTASNCQKKKLINNYNKKNSMGGHQKLQNKMNHHRSQPSPLMRRTASSIRSSNPTRQQQPHHPFPTTKKQQQQQQLSGSAIRTSAPIFKNRSSLGHHHLKQKQIKRSPFARKNINDELKKKKKRQFFRQGRDGAPLAAPTPDNPTTIQMPNLPSSPTSSFPANEDINNHIKNSSYVLPPTDFSSYDYGFSDEYSPNSNEFNSTKGNQPSWSKNLLENLGEPVPLPMSFHDTSASTQPDFLLPNESNAGTGKPTFTM